MVARHHSNAIVIFGWHPVHRVVDADSARAHLHSVPFAHGIAMRTLRFFVPLALVTIVAGCQTPRAQANMAEAVMNMGTAVQSMQQDLQDATERIDSLSAVVAHQDTLIDRLATLTHVPWPPPVN